MQDFRSCQSEKTVSGVSPVESLSPQYQCRISNSSKCSKCYGPHAFGGPALLCVKFVFYYMIERRPTSPQPGKVKIVFTLKPKHFAEGSEDSEENHEEKFQKLLAKLSSMHMDNFVS